MIDLQKSKIEAEALAKLRKEQFYRETLAQELAVMIDEHFKSKEPLREVIPQFVVALKDLVNTSCEIFYYLEGVEPKEAETEKTPAEVLEIINKKPIFSDRFVESAKKITEPKATEKAQPDTDVPMEYTNDAPVWVYHDGPVEKYHTIAEEIAGEKKNSTEPKTESTAAEPKKRIPSKDIISDEELDRHYFKEGLSIPVIASMFKVGASGLYKRIEQMKADRKKIEKECAR